MLVIIDLQEQYFKDFLKKEEEWEAFLERLNHRVQDAKESMEVVINMTSQMDGMTIPAVLEMFRDYPLRFGVCKDDFDGSKEIEDFIKRKKIPYKNIELCGAHKDVCVLDTWKGLKEKNLPVLPVREDLVIETLDNWRRIDVYPEGYLQPRNPCESRKSI